MGAAARRAAAAPIMLYNFKNALELMKVVSFLLFKQHT
jgi:hypothetical protein